MAVRGCIRIVAATVEVHEGETAHAIRTAQLMVDLEREGLLTRQAALVVPVRPLVTRVRDFERHRHAAGLMALTSFGGGYICARVVRRMSPNLLRASVVVLGVVASLRLLAS